jgi:SAM-dependent methyltransferase
MLACNLIIGWPTAMHLDVVDLRSFYYRTALGRVAQRGIRDQVVRFWDPAQCHGMTVAGYGFAVPLLRPYLADARRVVGLMPGPQGVMPWPAGMENVSCLVEESAWPLPTGMVDRLVVLHGLEVSEQPGLVLDEAHRVLGPGGRALFIVPNRSGLWSRRDVTPFGHGRPYSMGQLEGQLKAHGFTPDRHVAALFGPPASGRVWLRTADFWERTGRRLGPWIVGGVLMVEAIKQVWAPTRGGLGAVVKNRLRGLEGLARPVPAPGLPRRPAGPAD